MPSETNVSEPEFRNENVIIITLKTYENKTPVADNLSGNINNQVFKDNFRNSIYTVMNT